MANESKTRITGDLTDGFAAFGVGVAIMLILFGLGYCVNQEQTGEAALEKARHAHAETQPPK